MTIGIDARLWEQTGVGRYIRNLVLNLPKVDKKNSYVLFVSVSDKRIIEREISKLRRDKIKIVPVDVPWHSLKEQIRFPKILKSENLDLMHFTYFSLPIAYNGRYILTIHDLIIHHFSTGKASTKPLPIYLTKRFFYKKIIEKSAKKAITIIAVSNATKNEIVDHLGVAGSKVKVIYEAADTLGSPGLINPKFPYILYVGNLYPHKNIEKALMAFKAAKKPQKAKFVIVGKKDYFRKATEELVHNLGISEDIIFAGKVSDRDLGDYYSSAKATIVPSLMEGFGLPALEAMKNGCLVICSDISSLKEICQDSALYFNPDEMQSIKGAIENAMSAPHKELIEKGRERARQFSWSKMVSETLKVYESSFSIRSS